MKPCLYYKQYYCTIYSPGMQSRSGQSLNLYHASAVELRKMCCNSFLQQPFTLRLIGAIKTGCQIIAHIGNTVPPLRYNGLWMNFKGLSLLLQVKDKDKIPFFIYAPKLQSRIGLMVKYSTGGC